MRSLTTTALFIFTMAAAVGQNWPSFRGPSASGVADEQNLPDQWSAETGEGILFQVKIPGLAHSSPVIWGDRLFLTTAVSSAGKAAFVPGLYGSGKAAEDRSEHEWRVLCLNKHDGEMLWSRTATRGVPVDKRHIKATYANSTPATDGKRVVVLFGSEGLFAFSLEGEPLWEKDLGRLDVGAYDFPSYEWGSASSPILHEGKVIVQCDTQDESFILAADAETGRTIWRTKRDELPSWGTPAVVPGEKGPVVVTNGSNFIRGYDLATGEELWKVGGSSKITAPTPVFADGLVIVASGRAPERPIFALRTDGEVVWKKTRVGPYMPTPLIYKDKVYVLNNSGPFACYDLQTGKEHYHLRIPDVRDGFSASPIAADGKIYLSSEDGDIFVIQAGEEFELLTRNLLGEPIMATPAISGGRLYVRGARHLFAIGAR